MKVNLRDYQKEGVANIRFSYMQGRKSVLYVLPTGGGKTVIFSHIAEQAAIKGNSIDNLIIELDAQEVAILDGSAKVPRLSIKNVEVKNWLQYNLDKMSRSV